MRTLWDPVALFGDKTLELAQAALGKLAVAWLVLKVAECYIPDGRNWDVLFCLLALVFCWFVAAPAALRSQGITGEIAARTARAFLRCLLPYGWIVIATAEPAILLTTLAVLRLIGAPDHQNAMIVSALAIWLATGSVLSFAVFGLRAGWIVVILNAGGIAFGLLAGVGIHYLAASANAPTLMGQFDLAMLAAGQGATWPMTFILVGWALRTVSDVPDSAQAPLAVPTRQSRGARAATAAVAAVVVIGASGYALYHRQQHSDVAAASDATATLDTKAAVVREFYTDISAKNYGTAYALLGPELQSEEPESDFPRRYAGVAQMNLAQATDVAGTNCVHVAIASTSANNEQTRYSGTIRLAYDAQGRKWLIAERKLTSRAGARALPSLPSCQGS